MRSTFSNHRCCEHIHLQMCTHAHAQASSAQEVTRTRLQTGLHLQQVAQHAKLLCGDSSLRTLYKVYKAHIWAGEKAILHANMLMACME